MVKIAINDLVCCICCRFPLCRIIILRKQIRSIRIFNRGIHRISIKQITLASTFGSQALFCTGSPVRLHIRALNQRIQLTYYIIHTFIPCITGTFQFSSTFCKIKQFIMQNEYRSVDSHHQKIVITTCKTSLYLPLFFFIIAQQRVSTTINIS